MPGNAQNRPAPQDSSPAKRTKTIYWHRELPPRDAEAIAEHTLEAVSPHVSGRIKNRNQLWRQCYASLMAQARIRLEQELTRLGGDYAHVLDEIVESRHDDATGQAWLHGQFTYMLYRNRTIQRSSPGEDSS